MGWIGLLLAVFVAPAATVLAEAGVAAHAAEGVGLFAGTVAPGAAPTCVGDCNGDGGVTINELILGVNIALGTTALTDCSTGFDQSRAVTIDELIVAVNNALIGCAHPDVAAAVEANTEIDSAADAYFRTTAATDPVGTRMGATGDFIKTQSGVTNAAVFPDGLTVLINHSNGLQSAFMLLPDFQDGESTGTAAALAVAEPSQPEPVDQAADAADETDAADAADAAEQGDTPTVAVLIQGRDLTQKLVTDHYPQLQTTLHQMGFGIGRPDAGVTLLSEAAYTTDFFRNQLGSYQIIYVIGHGGNDGSKSVLATGKLGAPGASFPAPAGADATDLDKNRLLTALTSPGMLTRLARFTGFDTKPSPRYLVTAAFIANYYSSDKHLAHDSLVYIDGCNLKDDLPRALADAGAAAVVYFPGNTVDTETTQIGTPPIDRAFFAALAAGKSVDDAIETAKANASQVTLSVYPSDGGKLRFIPLTTVDFSLSCPNPLVGQPITFTQDTVTPDNAQITKWLWDFGDQSPPQESPFLPASSTNNIMHTYTTATEDDSKPGFSTPITVTLTVTDLFGHQVKKEKQIRLLTKKPKLQIANTADDTCPVMPMDCTGAPECADPASGATITITPMSGFAFTPYAAVITFTGPAATAVSEVDDQATGFSNFLTPRPDGSFRERAFVFQGAAGATAPFAFQAFDANRNQLCCGTATLTSLGPCSSDADCGSGKVWYCDTFGDEKKCNQRACFADDDCSPGQSCADNGSCIVGPP